LICKGQEGIENFENILQLLQPALTGDIKKTWFYPDYEVNWPTPRHR